MPTGGKFSWGHVLAATHGEQSLLHSCTYDGPDGALKPALALRCKWWLLGTMHSFEQLATACTAAALHAEASIAPLQWPGHHISLQVSSLKPDQRKELRSWPACGWCCCGCCGRWRALLCHPGSVPQVMLACVGSCDPYSISGGLLALALSPGAFLLSFLQARCHPLYENEV